MQIKFHNEDFPKGVEFDMGGLLFRNGETTSVSKEEAEMFEKQNGVTLEVALSRTPNAPGHFVPLNKDDKAKEGDN